MKRIHGLLCIALLSTAAFVSGSPLFALDDEAMDASIRQHRMGTLRIVAEPGTKVEFEQLRHEFWFGAALADSPFSGRLSPEDEAKYKEVFLANFNSAVTENALKWHSMQRQPGPVNYRLVEAMLDWTDENDIPLRGHNIFWGVPNFVQAWLKELPNERLEATVRERALDIGRRYRGRFAEYDLNNEMIHGNYYEQRLGPDITKRMADWVLEGDPDAVLYLNDYDILTGRRLDDYVRHIEKLRAQGVRIHGIGVQGHLHGDTFDRAQLQNALDRLAVFNLPIRVTEFNFPGQRSKYYQQRDSRPTPEEEEAYAQELTDYFRICFAHPSCEGILLWGFWERACWIPASALYRQDWTPTAQGRAYRELVFNQWWTRGEAIAGADGLVETPAFYGTYRLRVGSREKVVELKKGDSELEIVFD